MCQASDAAFASRAAVPRGSPARLSSADSVEVEHRRVRRVRAHPELARLGVEDEVERFERNLPDQHRRADGQHQRVARHRATENLERNTADPRELSATLELALAIVWYARGVDPSDLVGHRLPGGFTVVRHIATGGFAWVYEAQTPERAPCAIKVPHQSTAQGLKRFVREIKVMRELPRSAYCVRYVGDGLLGDGRPFLAMELVRGRTLARVLESGDRWDPRSACAIGTQLCAALRGMHRLGLASRDVSPNNIMLTEDNRVKLMDFGLVKDAQGLLELLEEEDILHGRDFAENLDAGLLLGTLDYVAPEQLADSRVNDPSRTQTDTWSDVYSVGLILWQMIAGKKVFALDMSGTDDRAVARRVLAYIDARVTFDEDRLRRPPSLPAPVFQILARCLRLDPRRRHRTAMELGQELQRYLETGQAAEQDEDERTDHVRLDDYLALLEAGEEDEATGVHQTASAKWGVRAGSSIPVVLDFDDETAEVVIPKHDPPPSSTGDAELDAMLAHFDEETRSDD